MGGRHKGRPETIDKETADQFAELGVTGVTASAPPETGVWDINWKSLMAFLDCQTQWTIVAGFGGAVWIGLDYGRVKAALEMGDYGDGVFDDLRHMEGKALPVLNGGHG